LHWHDLIDERQENDHIKQNLVVQWMENINVYHALVQDQRHDVGLRDMGHEKMMEELKQLKIHLLKKIRLDDLQDLRMRQDERFALKQHNLNNDIV
jgi:hypothetical protein